MFNLKPDNLFTQIPSLHGMKGGIIKSAGGDKFIWATVILLTLISLLVVYSATGSLAYKIYKGNTEIYLFKQLATIFFGIFLVYIAHRINYLWYSRLALWFILLAGPALIFTYFFGAKINDGSRWIMLPGIKLTIQTSDFAKLALFMYLSRLLSKSQQYIKDFKKGFLPIAFWVALICGLIMPANLSTALLTGATALILMFIGRVSFKHISLSIFVALIPVAFLVLLAMATNNGEVINTKSKKEVAAEKFRSIGRVGTWISRIQSYINSTDKDVPYQVQQSKIAIANGGMFVGLGPGNSHQRNFLPHPYSDFIYSIIIEEYGLLGGAFVIFVYLVFLFRCITIFRRCPYAFGAFLALALSFSLVIQAIANMAVAVNLLPVTGVTLPLVSMGGSSLIFTCISIGIILSVSRNVEEAEGKLTPEPIIEVIDKEGGENE
jgi:cell division protein FtsW